MAVLNQHLSLGTYFINELNIYTESLTRLQNFDSFFSTSFSKCNKLKNVTLASQ